MHYLGGKARIAKRVTSFLNEVRGQDQPYWEPFVGAGWILASVPGNTRYASDFSLPLISMWKALQNGWVPPTHVSEEEYASAKLLPDTDPLKAFIGFGCSFSGKFFGGYARDSTGRNYAMNAHNSIMKKYHKIGAGVQFFNADFIACDPPQKDMLIYCDPPYANTTGYSVGSFDHEAFWNKCMDLSCAGHTLVISEYSAPESFRCILEMPTKTDLRVGGKKAQRIERLFMPRS